MRSLSRRRLSLAALTYAGTAVLTVALLCQCRAPDGSIDPVVPPHDPEQKEIAKQATDKAREEGIELAAKTLVRDLDDPDVSTAEAKRRFKESLELIEKMHEDGHRLIDEIWK